MSIQPTASQLQMLTPRQCRAIKELLSGPSTVRQLFERVGCNGVPQLVASLREKGLQIHTHKWKGTDRDGKQVTYCTYVLSQDSFAKALTLLKYFRGES